MWLLLLRSRKPSRMRSLTWHQQVAWTALPYVAAAALLLFLAIWIFT